jgi:TfoX/Sxy family transcriptional regulator of competence genes
MPYDETLDMRIRTVVSRWRAAVDVRRMFGGVCHLLDGHMFCGVWRDYLILRLGEPAAREAMAEPGIRPMDVTSRPMKGWVMVPAGNVADEVRLAAWLTQARRFVATLPPKTS